MDLTEMLTDVKNHFEHGAELLASHVPALVDLAARIQADPLVQTAINLAVPEASRPALAGILKSFETEIAHVAADAKEAAQAAMAPPAEPEPAA